MIADLYLLTESIQHNGADSEDVILAKLNTFIEDLIHIDLYRDENKIFINPSIYSVNITETKNIFQILESLERDKKNFLYGILYNGSNSTDLNVDEVRIKCTRHNREVCSGIIAFNAIRELDDELTIIYNQKGWFDFRRFFLGIYPGDADFFIDECKKYFIKLFFHENNRTSIINYLHIFPKKIVKYLSDLNDLFPDFYENNYRNALNINDLLRQFSIMCEHDRHASLQGNPERRDSLTFDFFAYNEDADMYYVDNIYCEPHLKISKSDNYPQDSRDDYPCRIYFHFGKKNVENGRVLIGSIGPHVKLA
ncbi:hypothetical protein LJC54_02990 [Parabacteroides sp. OttesenSCG-928-J18]|nr:hypothetical protein [Parabacteroides sp. OttesenSCG-928-O15]MDL2244453.1 hypothetical protein [Parabacteroides sp. OttesenSCG-928-J18]